MACWITHSEKRNPILTYATLLSIILGLRFLILCYTALENEVNETKLQAISQSTGDISETANEEYFQYVLQRFETELPDYEEALIQNGLKESKRPRILVGIGTEENTCQSAADS